MEKGIYLIFLIFSATLFQVILTSSEKHIDKTWDVHIRKKRIVDKTPEGREPTQLLKTPYIVSIHQNGVPHCGGSILTSSVIITAAQCVSNEHAVYTILSGSSNIYSNNLGTPHKIIGKIIHHLYNNHTLQNDLALLHISPGINLIHFYNRKIDLYQGNVPALAVGTLTGWGCMDESGPNQHCSWQLRSTLVPIFSHEECRFFRGLPLLVSDQNICTYDKHTKKFGSIGDIGGPLVYDNKLVGVLSWTGTRLHQTNPDIYIMMSHPLIRNWIVANVRIIEGWI